MKTLTGLKLSEVVKLFEDGKVEYCRPFDGKYFGSLNHWSMDSERLAKTWDVQLKPQKREITLEQL